MATKRRMFRLADYDMDLLDQIQEELSAPSRSEALRFSIYRAAKELKLIDVTPSPRKTRGRPKKS